MKKTILLVLTIFNFSSYVCASQTMPIEYINVPTTTFNQGKYFLYADAWSALTVLVFFTHSSVVKTLTKKFEDKWNKKVSLSEFGKKLKERENEKIILDSIVWTTNTVTWPLLAYLFAESWKNMRIFGRLILAQGLKQDSIPVITGTTPWYTT